MDARLASGPSSAVATQLIVSLAGMLACLVAGQTVAAVAGVPGRLSIAGAVLGAMLLSVLATWLYGFRAFRLGAMLGALALALALAVVAIGQLAYGGLPRLERFFLGWFGGTIVLLGVPWLLGLALGLGCRRLRAKGRF